MADEDIKRFIRSGAGPEGPTTGVIRVLVELNAATADESVLERLRGIGLQVEDVVGNKVVGSIDAAAVDRLESMDDVKAVERSQRLHLRTSD